MTLEMLHTFIFVCFYFLPFSFFFIFILYVNLCILIKIVTVREEMLFYKYKFVVIYRFDASIVI